MIRVLFALLLVTSIIPNMKFASDSLIRYFPVIGVIALFYSVLVANLTHRRLSFNRINTFFVAWIFYCAFIVMSALLNFKYSGENAIFSLITLPVTVGLVMIYFQSRRNPTSIKRIIYTFCIVVQSITFLSIFYLFIFPEASIARYAGEKVYLWGIPIPQSFWGSQNTFGEFLLWSLFTVFLLHSIKGHKYWLLIGCIYIPLMVITGSRSILIALIVFLFAMLINKFKAKILFVAILSIMIFITLYLFKEETQKYLKLGSSGDIQRLELIKSTLIGFAKQPWLGYGPKNYFIATEIGATTPSVYRVARYYSPHNMYVRMLAELGVLGFVAWLYAVIYAMVLAWRKLRIMIDPQLKIMLTFLFAILVHRMFVHGLPGGISHDNLFPLILIWLVTCYARLAYVKKQKIDVGNSHIAH